jgi:H/ACA ribonucleoprotein complex subunit 2
MMDVSMGDVTTADADTAEVLLGALVPFAFPLAEDAKEVKKILKTVKKCEFILLLPVSKHHRTAI